MNPELMGLLFIVALFGGGVFILYIIQMIYDYTNKHKDRDKSS